MAHAHFGTLANVFKHLALAETIASLRPGEYWESHVGHAFNPEVAPPESPPARRLHGIHTFLRLAAANDTLRLSTYHRILLQTLAVESQGPAQKFPGSALLARTLIPETARRLLFCDTDADALTSHQAPLPAAPRATDSRKEIHIDKIECVQDDGVTVLRGAGILLPEPWTASTLAFIDPDDINAPTDSGISPLMLACELAARGIITLLSYGFKSDSARSALHQSISDHLQKSRLTARAQRFEGCLNIPADPAPATPWGWGLLTFNFPSDLSGRINIKLRALEAAYESSELPGSPPNSGAWKLTHAAI